MKVYTDFCYPTEIQDVVKMFYVEAELTSNKEEAELVLLEAERGNIYEYASIVGDKHAIQRVDCNGVDQLQRIRLRKRFAKIAAYDVLVDFTGKNMPWGSLTGIRPTKLADQLTKEGFDWFDVFTNKLGVSVGKAQLVADILQTQGSLHERKTGCADLYIGIPFCVSRCSYCSFTSGEIERLKKYVVPYVEALKRDIVATLAFVKEKNIRINNVYFGGGTPTSLNAEQLNEIMSCIDIDPVEYTVEAGRPDTIDSEKLDVLKAHGVDRISINPQTFNQSVLDIIGRKHSVQDIYDKYDLAKKYGFTVNMDLIAGLPTETYEMFRYSLDEAVSLTPDNITVHTLALKHGSLLKEQNYYSYADVSKMVDYSREKLYAANYSPYYMYRQKYMAQNLENVGYCKPNKPCLYNIGIMEEISDIIACGTNAISKRIISDENRIERAANAKDVITYINHNEEYLAKKFDLFD